MCRLLDPRRFQAQRRRQNLAALCRWIGFTLLSGKQGLTDLAPNSRGKPRRFLRLEPTQMTGRADPFIIHKYVYLYALSREGYS